MNQHIKIVHADATQDGLRKPTSFSEYVGQTRVKNYVMGLIDGAFRSKKSVPHLIILGPSGCGKTAFAECIASEIGSKFHRIICCEDFNRNDLCFLFERVSNGDVVYLDEAQSLSRGCQELLYQYFDRGTVPAGGETSPDSTIDVRVASVTIILSTNQPGAVRKELMNRLHRVELDDYSLDEINQLILQAASKVRISSDAILKISTASHGVPRLALMMLKELSYLSSIDNEIVGSDVERLYEYKKFSPEGLHHYHSKILTYLYTQPNQTARLGILSDRLGLDGSFIRREVEPVIIGKGFLMVTPMGRKLTRKGREYLAMNSH